MKRPLGLLIAFVLVLIMGCIVTSNESVFNRVSTIIRKDEHGANAIHDKSDNKDISVNEKGWIVGEDNKRIYFTADASTTIQIYDDEGNTLITDGAGVYSKDATQVGTIWLTGENQVEYIMRDGEYTFHVEGEAITETPVIVEYQDDGYFTHSETYSDMTETVIDVNISCYNECTIAVTAGDSSNSLSEIQSPEKQDLIAPSHIMTPEQLAERNA